MNKASTVVAVVAVMAVAFYGGRRSFGATSEYSHADIYDVAETCEEGSFVGGCKICKDCESWEYPAGGCTYFKDTFCTLCEPIYNCPQDNIRCDTKDDEHCLECEPGFYGQDCKPCLVCEAGDYELEKCTHESNTVCKTCTECIAEEFTETACTYFSDTICTMCESCPVGKFTDVVCQTVEESKLQFPESVYTVRPDTVCTDCTEPSNDGVQWEVDVLGRGTVDGVDNWVEEPCNIMKDTTLTDCFICPCEDRPTCQFMTQFCTPGGIHEKGEETSCKDCTKRRGPKEWEVFKCGGTSDALFKPCSLCMEGEYELQECTETSDTICPVCNTMVSYGLLNRKDEKGQLHGGGCVKGELRCTDSLDTTCVECETNWFGDTCCYHQFFGSCGTMTTRERIAARLGFEGETNEDFIDFCLDLCDEFPDCMAFEIMDGGVDFTESGANNLISKTAACYFKASFTQGEDAVLDGALAFKGEDPALDCYSNVCRQNTAFAGAYDHHVIPGDPVIADVAKEYEFAR